MEAGSKSHGEIKRVSIAFKYGGRMTTGSGLKRFRDRLIGWWTGYRYAHCELVFHSSVGTWYTCTVNSGSKVIIWPNKNTYDAPGTGAGDWKFHGLPLNSQQAWNLWQFCVREAQAERPYNKLGMWWNFSPVLRLLPINRQGRAWFCSEMVLHGLQQHCGIYLGRAPHTVSPDDLHDIMLAHGGQVFSGPPAMATTLSFTAAAAAPPGRPRQSREGSVGAPAQSASQKAPLLP